MKSENSVQCLFCSELIQRQRTPQAARVAVPSSFPSNYTQHLAAMALNSEHLCFIWIYFVHHQPDVCPKVIASLLYDILPKRFHRKALLLDSGDNLYRQNQFQSPVPSFELLQLYGSSPRQYLGSFLLTYRFDKDFKLQLERPGMSLNNNLFQLGDFKLSMLGPHQDSNLTDCGVWVL